MAKAIETEGNTVDEAVEAALSKLGVDRKSVEVEVIKEGGVSFAGGLDQSRAMVRVSLIEEGIKRVVGLVKNIIDSLGVQGNIRVLDDESSAKIKKINVDGPDVGLLIGRRGETLAAIQAIANIVMRKSGTNKKLEIDIENYRERRAERLKEMAKQAAERALRLRRPVLLGPMNAYERRVVHVALQDNNQVFTMSEGEEPGRQVRITPKQ
ncbi:MAG: KH domain-containing protein [Actinobacteria bacterium]|nr:KH domain-containing protein [Actinomycetota bacterium]